MQKDIKKIIAADYKNTKEDLPTNHRSRFKIKLQKELHKKQQRKNIFLKIAAVFLLLISFSILFTKLNVKEDVNQKKQTLGSLSPELQKIENYYNNAIKFELSKIKRTRENKQILEKYFTKLEQLTAQYKKESAQLNIDKINEVSINALIDNLQIRLQLLLQLKEQLQTIKNTKNEKTKI